MSEEQHSKRGIVDYGPSGIENMFPEFRAAQLTDEGAQKIFDDVAKHMTDGKDEKTICSLIEQSSGVAMSCTTYIVISRNIIEDRGPSGRLDCPDCNQGKFQSTFPLWPHEWFFMLFKLKPEKCSHCGRRRFGK